MDRFKDTTSNDIKFQGNDYLPSETTQNKEIMDNAVSEERADRGLRKLRKSHKNTNIVNSGS